jgi:hypothetical protein
MIKKTLLWIKHEYLAIIVFFLCSAIAIYPTLSDLNGKIIGWAGDNVQYVYMTGWFSKAIFNLKSPFVDPHLNYPGELILAATDMPYAGFILVSPLAKIFNPIFAYNALIFLSYFFSGYFTYRWILQLTKNRFAGIVSGLIFILLPFRIVHSYGHLQLVSTQYIPLFFWSLDSSIRHANKKNLVFLFVSTFLLSSGSAQYYLIICLIASLFYLLFMQPNVAFLKNQSWKLILTMGLGSLIGSLPYITAMGSSIYQSYSLEETRGWSASLADYFYPSRLHPIWGKWIEKIYPRKTWIEHTLYPGFFASLLAFFGCIFTDKENRHRVFTWLGVTILIGIISLGTDIHIFLGKPIQETEPFWLPAYYLGKLPIIDNMRVWARFAIIPLFFIALLSGIGIDAISKKWKLGISIQIIIAILIFIDLVPGRIDAITLNYRPIDQWIAQQEGDKPIAFLPAGADNYLAMYGSLLHERKLPAYNHPTHIPTEFYEFKKIAKNLPEEEVLDIFKAQGFQYLIFDPSLYNGKNHPIWDEIEKILEENESIKSISVIDGYIIAEFYYE